MMTNRDRAMMAAMARSMRSDEPKKKRSGCSGSGCTLPLIFLLLGLPCDIYILWRVIATLNKGG
jgi:hypothetical protein